MTNLVSVVFCCGQYKVDTVFISEKAIVGPVSCFLINMITL